LAGRTGIVLALGLTAALAAPTWAQSAKGVGVVTALVGEGVVTRQAARQVALKFRDDIFWRDVVETKKDSLARILLLGKSSVTVRELSRLELREELLPTGQTRSTIEVIAGKIRVSVAKRLMAPGDEVQIKTLNAVASVRGTDGIIEFRTLPDGTPETVITGIEGEFEVVTPPASRQTAMAEGGASLWLAQQPPAAPRVTVPGFTQLRVTGRVRTGASSLTGTPIIDLVALERVRAPR